MTTDCPNLNTTLIPECDLSFRLSTNYSGSSNRPLVTGTASFRLELCNDTVVFKQIPCARNLDQLVLGIPLRFVKDCFSYTINIPNIPGSLGSVIEVQELNTNTVLPVQLQVLNGYLYILIDISGQIDFTGPDAPSLELCFTTFAFDMIRKSIPCNCDVGCRPVTWSYGFPLIN